MENIPKLGLLSNPDTFAVLYEMRPWPIKKFVGRTECIYDNENPKYVTNFTVDYYFEET